MLEIYLKLNIIQLETSNTFFIDNKTDSRCNYVYKLGSFTHNFMQIRYFTIFYK